MTPTVYNDSAPETSFLTHYRDGTLRTPEMTPKEHDILFGRGKCFQLRSGNVKFRGMYIRRRVCVELILFILDLNSVALLALLTRPYR
jgi:hypothetical protein